MRIAGRAACGFLLSAVLLNLVSCAGIEEPDVTLTGLDVHGLSTDGLVVALLVDVGNPNAFGADIDGLTYRVLLDGIEVAEGAQEDRVTVPAKSTVAVSVPFTIKWSGMDKGMKKLLDGEEHEWRLKGSVRLEKGVINRTFRFSESGTFNAPEADDIDIDLDI